MDHVLEVENASKSYKGNRVLTDVSMTINKGDIYGFVGKNGAGKTTLIRIVSGLINADSGEYRLFGTSSRTKDILKERRKVCAMVEAPAIYPELSAADNMKMQCIITGKAFTGIHGLLEFVGLENTGKKPSKDFSLGMRQRLGIAMSLVNEPELMLLDEPINGLDPEGIKQIRELLLKMNKEKGITILISSHILTELSLFATRFGFIDKGSMIKEATIDDIKNETSNTCVVRTTDDTRASELLKELGYTVNPDHGGLHVDTDIDLMRVCDVFKNNGVSLIKHEIGAVDLEGYFMNLIGGNRDEIIQG